MEPRLETRMSEHDRIATRDPVFVRVVRYFLRHRKGNSGAGPQGRNDSGAVARRRGVRLQACKRDV